MYQEHEYCKEKEAPALYRIGMFAAMNHVTIKTLRHYDEQGLLKPMYVDEVNGYRYYLASQIADLHQILALKNMGFSLEDIRAIQNGKPEKELLLSKKQEILREIAQLTSKLAFVESYLAEETDIRYLTVNAAPYGVGFYHKIGFWDLAEQQEKEGILYTPMKMNF